MSMEFDLRLLDFVKKIETQRLEYLVKDRESCGQKKTVEQIKELFGRSLIVSIKRGKKYTKVDVGSSGKFMIENATETIYGIKAYGVVHKGKCYGTLSTTYEFYWGGWSPIKILKKEGENV
jgi:hypothetical protein